MDEQKRLLLATALSLLVLTVYYLVFPPSPTRPRPSPSPSALPTVAASAVPSPTAPASVAPASAVGDERERRIEVQGPDLTAAFTNRGARLVSWQLARFKDARGHPEEMVQNIPGGPRPLDLDTGDTELDGRLRSALFQASTETLVLGPGGGEVVFRYAEGDLEVEKGLRFQPSGYLVSARATVRRGGRELARKILWGPGLGNPSAGEMEVQGYQAPQAVVLGPAGVERIHADKIGGTRTVTNARWAGIESNYFAALWVPPAGAAVELRAINLPPGEDGKPHVAPEAAVVLEPGLFETLLYVGPKDHQTLTAADHDLARVVPLGEWIGPIVVALMALLRLVHEHVGNYGWSIVLLTVVINLVMAPLRHYSIANGIKMAKLAPEMKVIQDRYRKVPALDPKRQEMQKEVAALYERHGMSMGTQMAVGCLPLLLTMPFLIAFYRVLSVSIELRGAHFLWIPDLSQKDPYFITPVLMGISMFAMQTLTPTGADPAQRRMMMLMPLMLMGMFLWAPAGLNLYWLASNLCSLVQQAVTLAILRSREGAPARERRRR
ncbi:MAG TPA: membrane protein insertase YidC [Vicinamibacteria bacterium]|jgi:YidC/Oxa1 family membrane protein insertase